MFMWQLTQKSRSAESTGHVGTQGADEAANLEPIDQLPAVVLRRIAGSNVIRVALAGAQPVEPLDCITRFSVFEVVAVVSHAAFSLTASVDSRALPQSTSQ